MIHFRKGAEVKPVNDMLKNKSSTWDVYIIQTQSGKLYTGITTDPDRRFQEHLAGRRGAKFFSTSRPQAIVFRESHPDRSSASRREAEIKKWPRKRKLDLIGKSIKKRFDLKRLRIKVI